MDQLVELIGKLGQSASEAHAVLVADMMRRHLIYALRDFSLAVVCFGLVALSFRITKGTFWERTAKEADDYCVPIYTMAWFVRVIALVGAMIAIVASFGHIAIAASANLQLVRLIGAMR